ncbi:TetR/AcrR family transcriptional regulator [Chitinophaga filiformis]|uniref:TetR/AcrR family transcriptional regulator n=1 Tax=Chitinophaga filiformis TaxID=104663 RepID=UPI001F4481AD|nr:TetR/AcrR family transcriptional regulator [Chitinophaga filiformis]MCF6406339.1 TetR/AcrR family transcriptional regulator [Chitinophaga filiformis]
MARTKRFDEEEMLNNAMLFFWHKGYNGTSPQEILDELKLSRSSLYDTFGDKRSLFISTLKRYRNTVTAQIIEILEASENIPETLKLLFLQTKAQSFAGEDKRGCFMVNSKVELAPHDEEVAAIVKENREALENAFTSAIKRGQEKGQISKDNPPRSLARFVMNNLWGLSVHSKSGADKKVFDDIIRITMSVIK